MGNEGSTIKVPITSRSVGLTGYKGSINTVYSSSTTIEHVLKCAIKDINEKRYPIIYKIRSIKGRLTGCAGPHNYSFTKCSVSRSDRDKWSKLIANSITNYPVDDITKLGLELELQNIYDLTHKIRGESVINCEHMMIEVVDDPLICPIYEAMKKHYKFTDENLNHLMEFNHFKHEYIEKEKCRFNQNCKSFIRLQDGGNRLDDRCHIKLYSHPPRDDRQIKLAENMNTFIANTKTTDNRNCHFPNSYENDDEQYKYNKKDGYILALIEEVIRNGFQYDLCLKCGKDDECKHSEHSLLQILDQKMQHIRHRRIRSPLRRDHMLALLLYTGCDCNYDLCASQRNHNYHKWKWFDYCLYNAIQLLSDKETGSFKVYTGLSNVRMNKMKISRAWLPTYTSTSWRKEIAIRFMKGKDGMMIEVNEGILSNKGLAVCCDVSWISKFPDECEVLFARNIEHPNPGTVAGAIGKWHYILEVADEHNGIQILSMKQSFIDMLEHKDEDDDEHVLSKTNKSKSKESKGWIKREKGTKDKWEECGPKLVIKKSSVLTKSWTENGNSSFGNLSAKGSKIKIKWDITIKKGDGLILGICNTNVVKKSLKQSFANKINGFGYVGNNGYVQTDGICKKYGMKFKEGDKVSVCLNMKTKSLSFMLNGKNQGVAFNDIANGEYKLAAAFFEKQQEITLSKTTIWDIA